MGIAPPPPPLTHEMLIEREEQKRQKEEEDLQMWVIMKNNTEKARKYSQLLNWWGNGEKPSVFWEHEDWVRWANTTLREEQDLREARNYLIKKGEKLRG